MQNDGKRGENDGRIYRGARKEATGPDQLEVIPRVESPASQSMKFFLSPRCADLLEEWPSLFPRPLLSHTRNADERVSALDDCMYTSTWSASSSSALIAPYPPPRAGDTRLDSSQLHRRFTIQFHLQSVPAPRPATRRIDYRSALVCASRKENFGRASRLRVSYVTMQTQICIINTVTIFLGEK